MQVYAKLGKKEVDSFYPHDNDNTHTSPVRFKSLSRPIFLLYFFLDRGRECSIRLHKRPQVSCGSGSPLGLHQLVRGFRRSPLPIQRILDPRT